MAVSNNVATLTTGQSISSLEDGDLFYFRSNFTNTAAEVMVNIDSTGQHDIRINNRQNNGDEALPRATCAAMSTTSWSGTPTTATSESGPR